MGSTVGPLLSSSLGKDWYVEGVSYSADLSGINCNGLPGGIACVKQINALSAKCPNTKIVTSGYSQGAMGRNFSFLFDFFLIVLHSGEDLRCLCQ